MRCAGTGEVPIPAMLHRVVLCSSPEHTADEAARRLVDAVARGRHPVVGILLPTLRDAVRHRLAAASGLDDVVLLGGDDVVAPLPYLQRLATGPGRPTIVGEPGPREHDPEGVSLLEDEVEFSRAVAGRDWEHTCLYPLGGVGERIARRTHALLGAPDGDRPSVDYRSPAQLLATDPLLAHVDPDALVRDVVPHVDPDLRAWIAGRAEAVGLAGDVRDQVVLAVHEAARTAAESGTGLADLPPGSPGPPLHGLPTARLYVRTAASRWTGGGGLVCDVDAAWLPDLPVGSLPEEHVIKALWLAAVGCPDVDITVHALGSEHSRIRVSTRDPRTPRAPVGETTGP